MKEADLKVSIVELYLLPDNIKKTIEEKNLKSHQFKRAFIASKDQKILDFYELVSQNRGYRTKLFFDVEEAKTWLRQHFAKQLAQEMVEG